VLANLHFCDNSAMTGEDRYYKVKVFLLTTFEGTFTSVFKDKKSQNIRYQGFMLLIFLLDDRMIQIWIRSRIRIYM